MWTDEDSKNTLIKMYIEHGKESYIYYMDHSITKFALQHEYMEWSFKLDSWVFTEKFIDEVLCIE